MNKQGVMRPLKDGSGYSICYCKEENVGKLRCNHILESVPKYILPKPEIDENAQGFDKRKKRQAPRALLSMFGVLMLAGCTRHPVPTITPTENIETTPIESSLTVDSTEQTEFLETKEGEATIATNENSEITSAIIETDDETITTTFYETTVIVDTTEKSTKKTTTEEATSVENTGESVIVTTNSSVVVIPTSEPVIVPSVISPTETLPVATENTTEAPSTEETQHSTSKATQPSTTQKPSTTEQTTTQETTTRPTQPTTTQKATEPTTTQSTTQQTTEQREEWGAWRVVDQKKEYGNWSEWKTVRAATYDASGLNERTRDVKTITYYERTSNLGKKETRNQVTASSTERQTQDIPKLERPTQPSTPAPTQPTTQPTTEQQETWGQWKETNRKSNPIEWGNWVQTKAPTTTAQGEEKRVGTITTIITYTRTSSLGRTENRTETSTQTKTEFRSIPKLEVAETWGNWKETNRSEKAGNWSDWTVTKPATYTSTGERQRTRTITITITETRTSNKGNTENRTKTETRTETGKETIAQLTDKVIQDWTKTSEQITKQPTCCDKGTKTITETKKWASGKTETRTRTEEIAATGQHNWVKSTANVEVTYSLCQCKSTLKVFPARAINMSLVSDEALALWDDLMSDGEGEWLYSNLANKVFKTKDEAATWLWKCANMVQMYESLPGSKLLNWGLTLGLTGQLKETVKMEVEKCSHCGQIKP